MRKIRFLTELGYSMRFWQIFIFILLSSCEEKPLTYTKEELYTLAKTGDPNLSLILPGNINEVIPCTDYGEGCLSVHRIMAKDLEMIAVEFDQPINAAKGAKAVRGWIVRNWVLDDVTGEPVLERFVKETLKAEPGYSITK
jgi:hypothetical protein